MVFHNTTYTVRNVLFLALLLFAAGCKKEEERGSITGTITVEDGNVNSAYVELYTPPTHASTSVWTTTAAYPTIGFPFSLQAAWDHRHNSHLRLSSVTVGSDGKFEFPDMADGDYIIIARKTGYGWSIPRIVSVRGSALNVGALTLCMVETIPQSAVISTNTQWLAGRHYIIQTKITIAAGATLTIDPGVVVRLMDDARIEVLGTLVAEGQPDRYIHFTSNESTPAKSDWQKIFFLNSDNAPRFRYCTFKYADEAIRSYKPGGRIEYCYFGTNGAFGATLVGGTDTSMDSLIVRRNVMDNMNVGLRVNNVSTNRPLQIEKNAFFNCSLSAMELEAIRGGNVYCNWLYNCSSSSIRTGALFIRDMFRTDISRNEFRKAYYGIDLGSRVDSSVHIHHNYFNTMTYGMRFGLTAGENYASFPNFNDNCLLSITSYHILMEYCFVNDKDVDATNNYWSGLSGSSIPIFDDDENSLCPVVLTSPVLSSCPRSDVGYCRD